LPVGARLAGMTATRTDSRLSVPIAAPSGRFRTRIAELERPLLLAGLALVAFHLVDLAFSGPDTSLPGVLGIVAVPVAWALARPRVTRATRLVLAVVVGLVSFGFAVISHGLHVVNMRDPGRGRCAVRTGGYTVRGGHQCVAERHGSLVAYELPQRSQLLEEDDALEHGSERGRVLAELALDVVPDPRVRKGDDVLAVVQARGNEGVIDNFERTFEASRCVSHAGGGTPRVVGLAKVVELSLSLECGKNKDEATFDFAELTLVGRAPDLVWMVERVDRCFEPRAVRPHVHLMSGLMARDEFDQPWVVVWVLDDAPISARFREFHPDLDWECGRMPDVVRENPRAVER
jgi:hypothetical protein